MPRPALLLVIPLLLAGTAAAAPAADRTYLGAAVPGYSGYSPGGAIYLSALPLFAEVSLDGTPIGRAHDLQAALVEARVGFHLLTVTAPGYEPVTVEVWVVRDWTTRVRLTLIPAR